MTRIDPRDCPCKGTGYVLTDYDTWEKCSVHHFGQAKPEGRDLTEMPDGRPIPPLHVQRAAEEGFTFLSDQWWDIAIKKWAQGDAQLAFFCWEWGVPLRDIWMFEDRITNWAA